MLTLNDIINANFRKSSFSGYRPEDVDAFLDLVKDSYEQLIKKNIEQKDAITSLKEENEQMVKKINVLAERVETYRDEEDEIKNALVSAQKLGDASIREARHKAEIILKDANIKADRIVSSAQSQIGHYERELEEMKRAVSDFRSALLEMYKQHLTLIDALPNQKAKEQPTPAEEASGEPAAQQPEATEQPEAAENPEEPAAEQAALEEKPAEAAEEASVPAAQEAPADDDTFTFDVTGFETPAEEPVPSHDMRYASLKFGENYDVANDPDSPLDIFQKHQKS